MSLWKLPSLMLATALVVSLHNSAEAQTRYRIDTSGQPTAQVQAQRTGVPGVYNRNNRNVYKTNRNSYNRYPASRVYQDRDNYRYRDRERARQRELERQRVYDEARYNSRYDRYDRYDRRYDRGQGRSVQIGPVRIDL